VGYQWDNGLILEVEAAYRRNQLDFSGVGNEFGHGVYSTFTSDFTGATKASYNSAITIDGDDGHVSAVSLMANAWYEFNLSNEQWKPYIGGGIGIAWLDMHGLADARQTSSWTKTTFTKSTSGVIGFHGDESGFAWQLGAGIGYEFAPGKQITLDYRFFNGPTMDNVQFHEVENDIDYDYSAHNVMIGVRLGL
jgi:opacity protein-like surface antigen